MSSAANFTANTDSAQFETQFNTIWLFMTASFVFFKQSGLGLIESGSVQSKNVKGSMMVYVVNVCITAIAFWLIGFALAYGCDGTCKDFIGDNFDVYRAGLVDPSIETYLFWYKQFVLALTCVTVFSGSLAERSKPHPHVLMGFLLAVFVYPVTAHWMWGGGWLQKEGALDFSGGGVVHLLGGSAGFIATVVLGPRLDRFSGKLFQVKVKEFEPSSAMFAILGAHLTWAGWYGFNCVGVNRMVGREEVIGEIALNTTLAPAAALLTMALLNMIATRGKTIFLFQLANGAVSGLVAVSAGAPFIEAEIAVVVGVVAGLLCWGSRLALRQLKIDDSVDIIAKHFVCGIWSLLVVGLFAREHLILKATGRTVSGGLFYSGDGSLLKWQVVAALAIGGWGTATSAVCFFSCKYLNLFRVDQVTENYGLDKAHYYGEERNLQNIALAGIETVDREMTTISTN